MRITHNKRDYPPYQTHDVISANGPCIKWVAYYSDCQTELLPVLVGHRVSLEYRLYIRQESQDRPALDLTLPRLGDLQRYELLTRAEEMLFCSSFMPNGGILGFYCAHLYPTPVAAHGAAREGARR